MLKEKQEKELQAKLEKQVCEIFIHVKKKYFLILGSLPEIDNGPNIFCTF